MAKKKAKGAATGSIIDKDRAKQYHVDTKTKTASGRRSIDSNDKVAKALRGKSLDEVKALAKKNGFGERFDTWKSLNAGQQRMAVGNVLRGMLRRKEEVQLPA